MPGKGETTPADESPVWAGREVSHYQQHWAQRTCASKTVGDAATESEGEPTPQKWWDKALINLNLTRRAEGAAGVSIAKARCGDRAWIVVGRVERAFFSRTEAVTVGAGNPVWDERVEGSLLARSRSTERIVPIG